MPSSICKSLQTAWANLQPANSEQYLKTQIQALAFTAAVAIINPLAAVGFAALAVVYNASGCFFPKKITDDLRNGFPNGAHLSNDPKRGKSKLSPSKLEAIKFEAAEIVLNNAHLSNDPNRGKSKLSPSELAAIKSEAAESSLQSKVSLVLEEMIENISGEQVDHFKEHNPNPALNTLLAHDFEKNWQGSSYTNLFTTYQLLELKALRSFKNK